MLDLFTLSLVVLVVTIVAFIVRAVRLTNDSIARASRDVPLSRPDVARRIAEEIRARDVRCPRCGAHASAMLGTEHRYKCDACAQEFDGPAHIPTDIR
jgi:DNA-directed RNA polymerase subunit RPC12/RpoP